MKVKIKAQTAPVVTERTAEEALQCLCVRDATCTSRSLINSYQITLWHFHLLESAKPTLKNFLDTPTKRRERLLCSFVSTQEFTFQQCFTASFFSLSHKEEEERNRAGAKCELAIHSCLRCSKIR